MAIFEGDLSGSPSKRGMTVISDQSYNIRARDPLGIPQVFSFSTATVWGHAHDDTYWYAQKSRGILMISYLLCLFITPCIRLKLHSHSSIVLKTLSERYPLPSSSEDEQWLDPGLPIGKNGELHHTQEDKHIFILPHFTTIRSDQIDYPFFPNNQ